MYLVNVATQKLEYKIPPIPKYAILSHRWEDEELSYREVSNGTEFQSKKGYYKFQKACSQAKDDGCKYVWIDTCCIDKDSSAELSEAINSMYKWYRDAEICYAFLSDFAKNDGKDECQRHLAESRDQKTTDDAVRKNLPKTKNSIIDCSSVFTQSLWFTRGWTLQELIAPRSLRFYDSTWNCVGTRDEFGRQISAVTRIPSSILCSPFVPRKSEFERRSIEQYSLAQRMSWAAGRKCTRDEDRAYSLLGLLGINMPLLYGEGSAAFSRLQKEAIRHSTDDSILAWTGRHAAGRCKLFATSPDDFGTACARIVRCPERQFNSFEMSNAGLNMKLPICYYPKDSVYFAILRCRFEDDYKGQLALVTRGNKGLEGLSVPIISDATPGFYQDLEIGDRPRVVSIYQGSYDKDICPRVTLTETIKTTKVKPLSVGRMSILVPQIHSTSPIFKMEDWFPESWNVQTGVVMLHTQSSGLDEGERSWGYVVFNEQSTKKSFVLAFGFNAGQEHHIFHKFTAYKEQLDEDRNSIEDRLFDSGNRQKLSRLRLDGNRSLTVTTGVEELLTDKVFVINVAIEDPSGSVEKDKWTPSYQDHTVGQPVSDYSLTNYFLSIDE